MARLLLLIAVAVMTVGAAAAGLRDQLVPCHVRGLGEPALCGTYPVFEDRAAASGRKIDLKIVFVKAKASEPKPDPLFLFAGGPGQSITQVGPILVRALADVRLKRDIVLVDQRGTGGSNPLVCDPGDDSLGQLLRVEPLTAEEAAECVGKLDADPRQYTTDFAVDDIDEVRKALGYDRINLWGGSYGTRFALVYIRRHPETVRTAILDGVAPMSMPLPLYMARDAERAMGLLISACAADAHCAAAYPTLGGDLTTLLDRLAAAPPTVTVSHPRTGVRGDVTITRRAFAGAVRGLLYDSATASLVPLIIRDGLAGRFDILLAALVAMESATREMSAGLMLSVLCAEDLPRVTDAEAAALYAGTFVDDTAMHTFRGGCAVWPHGPLPAGFADPVESNLPVLLLSGELDPVTPPAWADETARHLANSRHVVVPGTGHGVTVVDCIPELVAEFINEASVADLKEADCAKRRRRAPFFLDFAGPTP